MPAPVHTLKPEPAPVATHTPPIEPDHVERTYLNAAVEKVINNPPSLSRDNGASLFIPGGTGHYILESAEIIGFLQFSADANPDRNNYRFRTYSKIFRQEINGDGYVIEKVYHIMDPLRKRRIGGSIGINKGSVEWVDAGFYKAKWSLGSYLSYDETKVKAAGGTEDEFEDRMREHARAHVNEPTDATH